MHNINEIEQLFSKDLKSPIFIVLANYYYDKRLYQHAQKVCEIGLEYNPNSIEGNYLLAKTFLVKEEIKKAEHILELILKKQPYHLNAVLLLINIKKLNGANKIQISNFIKRAIIFYPDHPVIKQYVVRKKKQSNIKKSKKKIKPSNQEFKINTKLATQTLYHLLFSQKKYKDAQNVLLIMKGTNKNKHFVAKELKKIQQYIN